MFLVLRMLVLFSIAEGAFGDDDEKFGLRPRLECDTKTPGCQKMCENQFYPIQPSLYWALQLLFVSLPIMIFMVYVSHKREKVAIAGKIKHASWKELTKKKKAQFDEMKDSIKADRVALTKKKEAVMYENPYGQKFSTEQIVNILDAEERRIKEAEKQLEADYELENAGGDEEGDDRAVKSNSANNSTPPKLFLAYALMVFCRTAIEAAFLVFYFHIYTFKFIMPAYYKCNRAPCNNEVTCYVDRPKQKTLVIWVMFGTGCVTVMIGLIEMWSLGVGSIYEAWSNRHDDITRKYKVGHLIEYDTLPVTTTSLPSEMSK